METRFEEGMAEITVGLTEVQKQQQQQVYNHNRHTHSQRKEKI